ncbi:hypothetical protein GGR95_003842, partial [Sulfitobacter undariae]
ATQHWAGKALSPSNERWLKRALGAALKRDRSTSNEIMRGGWVSALSQYNIENNSIGASSSTAGIFSYAKSDRKGAEFAILSYEMNEHTIARSGLLSHSEIRENWRWLTSKLRRDGTTPIILILPRATNNKMITTVTRDLQREIALELGVHVIDLSELFIDAARIRASIEGLMQDNSHMTLPAAKIVGNIIGRCLDDLRGTNRDVQIDVPLDTEFQVVWMHEYAKDNQKIKRKTSVTSAMLVQLEEHQSLTIPCPDGAEIVAVVVNRLASGGILKVGKTAKKLAFCNSPEDVGKFMLVVSDFAGGTVVTGNSLTMWVERDGCVTEPTHMAKEIADGYDPMIEIEAIILKIHLENNDVQPALSHAASGIDLVKRVVTDTDVTELSKL